MSVPQPFDPLLPSAADAQLAAESSRVLAAVIGRGAEARLRVHIDDEILEVPVAAMKLFVDVLAQMALGRAVQIVPHQAELTTQQAADFLNVSRPYLIKQLEAGTLAFHRVGTHRRIYFQDLLAYRERASAAQTAAVDELLQLSQAHGVDLMP